MENVDWVRTSALASGVSQRPSDGSDSDSRHVKLTLTLSSVRSKLTDSRAYSNTRFGHRQSNTRYLVSDLRGSGAGDSHFSE